MNQDRSSFHPSSFIPHPSKVPAAGVEPAPPRLQGGALPVELHRDHEPVPRQGIEPCVCRLKAGGFAIEACEASPSSGGWNRTSAVHLQRVASVPARNPPESINQLPRLESNQRRPPSEGGISTSTESSAVQATSSGGRNRTYKLRFNRAPPYHSAPHRCA